MLKLFLFSILFTSCALLRPEMDLRKSDLRDLLGHIKMVGEGKVRLNFREQQYVLSIDSVLNQEKDWILAVTVPLHGEEVLIFRSLDNAQFKEREIESFEKRIKIELQKANILSKGMAEKFLQDMRSLVRFSLSEQLGLKTQCSYDQTYFVCELGHEKFQVQVSKKEVSISKLHNGFPHIQLVVGNYLENSFKKSEFRIISSEQFNKKSLGKTSLEFFW